MEALDPLSPRFWSAIGTALLCGTFIGLERQLRGKAVGVRTSTLICLSTYVFVQLGAGFEGDRADPTRVLGQVVTGVGFLGAGVILARGGVVVGVTTASVIWMLASIGATIGFGEFYAAIVLSLITVVVLIGIDLFEASLRRSRFGNLASEDDLTGADD